MATSSRKPECGTKRACRAQSSENNVGGTHRYVTHDYVWVEEFYREIDRLIRKLENIRREVRAKFSAADLL